MNRQGAISIAKASHMLSQSYNQTLRLVLLGHLRGWQNPNGRWAVDPMSVESLKRRLNQTKRTLRRTAKGSTQGGTSP